MSNIESKDREMNQMIEEGRILDAFEKFTAEDVVMRDGEEGPWEGKEANREREKEFVNFIEKVHEVTLHEEAVGDDVSFSEWTFHATFKNGEEMDRRQIERRTWRDGKVVDVRFF